MYFPFELKNFERLLRHDMEQQKRNDRREIRRGDKEEEKERG